MRQTINTPVYFRPRLLGRKLETSSRRAVINGQGGADFACRNPIEVLLNVGVNDIPLLPSAATDMRTVISLRKGTAAAADRPFPSSSQNERRKQCAAVSAELP